MDVSTRQYPGTILSYWYTDSGDVVVYYTCDVRPKRLESAVKALAVLTEDSLDWLSHATGLPKALLYAKLLKYREIHRNSGHTTKETPEQDSDVSGDGPPTGD